MRTIMQHIGPLIGEADSGTIFGQPNGSISLKQGYVPVQPIPTIPKVWELSYLTVNDIPCTYIRTAHYTTPESYEIRVTNSTKNSGYDTVLRYKLIVNVDESYGAKIEFATDSNFTDIVETVPISFGNYGTSIGWGFSADSMYSFIKDKQYYCRFVVITIDGVVVGTSNILEFVGYTPGA